MIKFLRKKKNKYKSVYRHVADHKQYLVNDFYSSKTNMIQNGPFKGVSLSKFETWNQSDYVATILGQYELELHEEINQAIDAFPDCVINIGCSDGYYAVGLKSRLPHADVYAYDIDVKSFEALMQNSIDNSLHVKFGSHFDWLNADDTFSRYNQILFVIDIEGAEIELLKLPESILRKSIFIIETHDLFVPGISEKLSSFFAPTHTIKFIYESGRNPNMFRDLDKYSNFDKYLILIELRGGPQKWLIAYPKK